jgi:hypothetical protein
MLLRSRKEKVETMIKESRRKAKSQLPKVKRSSCQSLKGTSFSRKKRKNKPNKMPKMVSLPKSQSTKASQRQRLLLPGKLHLMLRERLTDLTLSINLRNPYKNSSSSEATNPPKKILRLLSKSMSKPSTQ